MRRDDPVAGNAVTDGRKCNVGNGNLRCVIPRQNREDGGRAGGMDARQKRIAAGQRHHQQKQASRQPGNKRPGVENFAAQKALEIRPVNRPRLIAIAMAGALRHSASNVSARA